MAACGCARCRIALESCPPRQTKLSVYLGDELIHEQVLSPGEYLIGQEDGAGIRFKAEHLAARHARLRLGFEQCTLEDLGSQSGTYLNGKPIAGATMVQASDSIRVGGARLVLGLASAEPAAPPPVSVSRLSPEEMRGPRKYDIGKVIARGGMGMILSARQIVVQREVAMKLMHDCSKADSVARFFQEAQITAQLEHPNIVPIHELSVNQEGQPFYTMKLVRGTSLKKVLDRLAGGDAGAIRQWPLTALLTVFQKLCDALAFAHARGVIHRDLKPDNIMLGEYGEALVMDWGIAKVLGRASPGSRVTISVSGVSDAAPAPAPDAGVETIGPTLGSTIVGSVMGTPQYMPPEQANGEVELMDERTDIYSLGAILYHLLALRQPFDGRNPAEVLLNVRAGRILPFGPEKLPHLPGGRLPASLAAVALQAMSLEKADRYPNVKALQTEIEAYQSGFATSAENASVWKLASLFFRRHRTTAVATALLLFAAVVFALNLVNERNRAERASLRAEIARRAADVQRDAAEDQLYLSDMLQAGRQIDDGRPDDARVLLRRHRVEPSGRELRGWEWFYLSGRLNQERLRVSAHTGGVFALAASANGMRLASGGADGEVAIWLTRGLVPEFRLRGSNGVIQAVAWHSAGKLLAAGDSEGNVRVWDIDTRKSVAELHMESGQSLRSVAWRPNDGGTPTLAIGGLQRAILLWRPMASEEAAHAETFALADHAVAALSWSADGARLAVGELDASHTLVVFDFATRAKALSTAAVAGNDIFAVAIDPTGKYVASGAKHLQISVYDMAAKKRIFDEQMHHGFVSALAWDPAGKELASASHDGTIRIFSPANGKQEEQVLCGHQGEVNALIWTPLPPAGISGSETTALFSGGADGTLRAWAPAPGTVLTVKPTNWISAANWSPDGARLAVANFRDSIYLVEPSTGLSIPLVSTHGNVFDAEWSPSGERIATASRNMDRVEVLDVATGRSLGVFALDRAYRVAWSPSGRYLAAAGPGGVKVWDTKTGAPLSTISRPAGCVVWDADERRIVLGGEDGAIQVWDGFTGAMIAEWRAAPPLFIGSMSSSKEPPRQVFDLDWSPDRKSLAFVTQDTMAGVIDVKMGKLVRTFPGHTGGIWRLCWSPDGRRLATAGQDGATCIYDTRSGGQVALINHGAGNVELHALDWSPDGRQVLSGGFDRLVRIWDAQRGLWIEQAEQLAVEARLRPNDLEAQRRLARICSLLGWAEDARRAFALGNALDPEDAELSASTAEAEYAFTQMLETASPESAQSKLKIAKNPRAIGLLNAIHDRWDGGDSAGAVDAWSELATFPAAAEILPLAGTYLSRAHWTAAWFPSTVDPRKDLEAWRSLAAAPDAVSVNVKTLCFPYLRRSPKELLLSSELSNRGPDAGRFGMIARARLNLPAGKWRFRVSGGGGGVRVMVDGKTVIENWIAGAPGENVADYEQASAAESEVVVEHFVTDAIAGFQFLLEPVVK